MSQIILHHYPLSSFSEKVRLALGLKGLAYGSVAKLEDAVRIMAKLQLGRDLPPADVADIVAFLESLTGEVPANFAQAPILPVSLSSR